MSEPDNDKANALPILDPADHFHPDSRFVAFLANFIGKENPVLLRAAIENVTRALRERETK